MENLEGDYKGKFYPVLGMDKALHQKLIDDHYLFKDEDRFLESARGLRFWPVGRAIFLNDDKTFIVWVNEEDHIRMISMQMGGDLGTDYFLLVMLNETFLFMLFISFYWHQVLFISVW